MIIITVANQKGGSGKTTFSQLFANIQSQAPFGKRILLLDLDPQLSTYKSRQESLNLVNTYPKYDVLGMDIANAKNLLGNLHKIASMDEVEDSAKRIGYNTGIERIVNLPGQVDVVAKNQLLYLFNNNSSFLDSYDIILIDLPGTLVSDQEISDPIIYSDMVVVPFKPTDKDVTSTLTFMEVLYALREVRQSKKLDQIIFSYINEHNRTTDYTKVKKILTHFSNQNVICSEVNLTNRKLYSGIDTMGDSLYQMALANKADKNINQFIEIKNFAKELNSLLEKLETLSTTTKILNQ